MSNIFWKNLHLCFSTKLKPENESSSIFPPSPTKQDDTVTSSSSSSSVTLQVLKNFNSLYELTNNSSASTSKSHFAPSTDGTDFMSSDSSSDVSDSDSAPPDFATVFASQRFFFSSPGLSNSIIGSSSSSSLDTSRRPKTEYSANTEEETVAPQAAMDGGGIAVKKYSPDPYRDFRFSMQEMIEARKLTHDDVKKDWEFLHELLLRYLTLNPKNTHKFIISAFADTVLCLLSSSSPSPESDCNPGPGNHRR